MPLVILFAVLGIVARIVVPYLFVLKDHPETKFDRAYILPAIVSVLIGVLTSPLTIAALPPETWQAVTPAALCGVFLAAWGMTDIVRLGQKQA